MDRPQRVYDSILDLLPDAENPTPLVRLNRLNPAPDRFTLYAKLEWMNPFGSVKDRAAWFLLRRLEEEGRLVPGGERGIVEPTSGNTGISLAVLAAVRGYRMLAVVPEKVPLEKKLLLRLAGAELEVVPDALCPSPGMGEGAIGLAKTYAKAQGASWAMPNQYENEANVEAHVETTGPEIWRQTEGAVTHLFVALGTCGTVTGLARFLRARKPDVKVIAVQPSEGHDIPGLRNLSQLEVSKLYDPTLIDAVVEVDYPLAYSSARALVRAEGLLAGPSAGLVYEGARRVIARQAAGGDPSLGSSAGRSVGVMVFPDNAFKYTSNFAHHLPELLASADRETVDAAPATANRPRK